MITVGGGETITTTCTISVVEGFEAAAPDCVIFDTSPTDTIGTCLPIVPQPDLTQVTLTMAVAGAGSGTTNPAVGTYTLAYDYGEVVDISALINTGSVFTGWSENVAVPGLASTTVTMNGDQTVTATFDLTQVTLTMAVAGAGSGTTDPVIGTHTYDYGEVVDIEAIAAVGSVFTGWSTNANIDDDTAAITTVTMNGDQTATATFDLLTNDEYTLTVNIVGSGSVTKSPDQATYLSGIVVTLDPQAAADWTFTGWSGDLSGSNDPKNITMNSDKTVTATFTQTTSPEPVDLGTAARFGIFGGSAGMTNTGNKTVITGSGGNTADIGTIATGNSAITGFHERDGGAASIIDDSYSDTLGADSGQVTGRIYTCTVSTTGPTVAAVNDVSCGIATQARLDAEAAYIALAAMPSDGTLAGNLANLTIPPGVWTNSSSVLIEGGDLTLDAGGDANAVFVFQIGSTLTVGGPGVAAPQSIILTGDAQAKNVFWQVGTAATINAGGGGTMEGTIIANSGVTFSTAGKTDITRLNGRALSLISSVTMVNTVITVPAP
jgi:uncharacterized repeat protein (TIGR02543 family)